MLKILVLLFSLLVLPLETYGVPAALGAEEQAVPSDLESLFPEPEAIDTDMTAEGYYLYSNETLFDYINGGAEVYLELGFIQVGAREYLITLEEETYFTLDIYDMAEPVNAFGIYCLERYGDLPDAGVGVSAALGGGSLIFWAQQYYVKIRADDEGGKIDSILMKIGHWVAKRIGDPGEPPEALDLFPEQHKKAHSERFARRGLFGQDYLHGFTTTYQNKDERFKLHLCVFDSGAAAQEAEKKLVKQMAKSLAPAVDGRGFRFVDPSLGTGRFLRVDPYLAIVEGLLEDDGSKAWQRGIVEGFFDRVVRAAQQAKEQKAAIDAEKGQDSEKQ